VFLSQEQDDYPDRLLWVSDSSSLVLRSGTGDLSRRFVSIVMPLLSFREFVALEALVAAMLAEGRFTEQEFTSAVGKTPSVLRAAWIKNKSGAMTEIVKLEKFISSKCISRNDYLALIEATRIPGDDSATPALP